MTSKDWEKINKAEAKKKRDEEKKLPWYKKIISFD
jgi:hypothetical protein